MSDLVYGGGGGGGGYYPPSFDPNNPMGSGGGGSGNYIPQTSEGNYYSLTKQYADSSLTPEWFSNNFNAANPYKQSYMYYSISTYSNYWQYIASSGNKYTLSQSSLGGSYYDIKVYNNAYTDFENKAKAAQDAFYANEKSLFDKANTEATSDLIASYGNVKSGNIKNDINTLADLNAKVAELQFQDDITKYLNRVTDSSNIDQINDLKNQISELEKTISKELLDYWRREDMLRKKEREFFTWDFAWLNDPYFGRGGHEIYQFYLHEQKILENNISMITDGSIYDWLAGGIYLNAAMAGGDMAAAYMPNDYYSVGLQYQVKGTDINEGFKSAFPYDSMAGSGGFGLNSSSRAAYKVLEL